MWRFAAIMGMALGFGAGAQAQTVPPDQSFFTLASGDVTGNYFATARAICTEVNRQMRGKMRCSPEATPGSVYNLVGVANGRIDFAIVQSDWLAAVLDGSGVFASSGAMLDLRGVMALYQEQIAILAARDAPINGMADLVGARIDLGPPASGRRATANRLLGLIEIDPAQFGQLSELTRDAAIDELCAGRIDAVILATGHPDKSVARAITDCGARLVPFLDPRHFTTLTAAGLYAASSIPAGTYGAASPEIATFAVTPTMVARHTLRDGPDLRVAAIVSAIRSAQDSLRRRLPVLAGLKAEQVWDKRLGLDEHPDIQVGQ